MDYTFYDARTGEIYFTLASNTEPASENGEYIEGSFDPKEYLVINGSPSKKSDAEIEQVEIDFAWIEFRNIRNGLLKDSDWTQVPDAPVDQAAWAAYRQQLRDLPDSTEDPRNPVWPTPPA